MEACNEVLRPHLVAFGLLLTRRTRASLAAFFSSPHFILKVSWLNTNLLDQLGLSSLLPTPISQSSAIQRRGRAGREAKGKCYRLYTETDYKTLRPSDAPAIQNHNVVDVVFTMKSRGVDNVSIFCQLLAKRTFNGSD
jgi:hypothetical protein